MRHTNPIANSMTNIAFLGTGLLGAGFVANLLAKGHGVRVWNRTASKTEALVQQGASAAADPAAAVRGASHVHLALSEDSAVDEVMAALRPGLGEGVPVIDHSTNLPAKVAERFTRLRAEGTHYVPAPVFMSPQNAREASGMMLIAGPKQDCDALTEHLSAMTGHLHWCGERPDLAAAHKLSGNSMFFAITAAMNDVLAIGRGNGIDDKTMLSLYDVFPIGKSLPWLGGLASRGGTGPAMFELTMARKDARLMLESAGEHRTLVVPSVAAAMDRAIERGDGDADFAAFTRP